MIPILVEALRSDLPNGIDRLSDVDKLVKIRNLIDDKLSSFNSCLAMNLPCEGECADFYTLMKADDKTEVLLKGYVLVKNEAK
jgi:hypothetical protein